MFVQTLPTLWIASGKNNYNQRVRTVPARYFSPASNASDVLVAYSIKQILTDNYHNVDSVALFQKETADFSRYGKTAKRVF